VQVREWRGVGVRRQAVEETRRLADPIWDDGVRAIEGNWPAGASQRPRIDRVPHGEKSFARRKVPHRDSVNQGDMTKLEKSLDLSYTRHQSYEHEGPRRTQGILVMEIVGGRNTRLPEVLRKERRARVAQSPRRKEGNRKNTRLKVRTW